MWYSPTTNSRANTSTINTYTRSNTTANAAANPIPLSKGALLLTASNAGLTYSVYVYGVLLFAMLLAAVATVSSAAFLSIK